MDVSKAHPLSLKLTFNMKSKFYYAVQIVHANTRPVSTYISQFLAEVGTFELVLSYLPNFSAVCVSVVTATTVDSTHSGSANIDKSTLLSCLFEGDTGRVSPNTVVSYNIRRHGGDVFSAAVRQYGFPYKWVQSLCGISVLSAGVGGGEGG